jgi:hypothetical protein
MTDDGRTNTHLTQRTKREMRVSRTSAGGPRTGAFCLLTVPCRPRCAAGPARWAQWSEDAHPAHPPLPPRPSPLSLSFPSLLLFPFVVLCCVLSRPVPSYLPLLSARPVRQQRTAEQSRAAPEREGGGREGGTLQSRWHALPPSPLPTSALCRRPVPPAGPQASPPLARSAHSRSLARVSSPRAVRRRASAMAPPKPPDSGSPPSPDSPQPESRPPRIRAVPAEEARFLWTFFRHKPLPKVRGEGGSTGE